MTQETTPATNGATSIYVGDSQTVKSSENTAFNSGVYHTGIYGGISDVTDGSVIQIRRYGKGGFSSVDRLGLSEVRAYGIPNLIQRDDVTVTIDAETDSTSARRQPSGLVLKTEAKSCMF